VGFTSSLGTADSTLGQFQILGLIPSSSGLELLSVVAVRENVVQLAFNLEIYFSGLLDTEDASNPAKYSFTPDTSSMGWDGNPPKAIGVSSIALAQPADLGGDLPPDAAYGSVIDVTLDRPMSPYPASYSVTVVGIYDSELINELTEAVGVFPGVYRRLQPNDSSVATPSRDFANPQTASDVEASALAVPLPPGTQANLGSFQVDDSGDYAWDAGLTGVKKRVLRRAISTVGAFLHLPSTYGVGFLDQVKQLGTAHTQDALADSWEAQIQEEPEVVAAQVTAIADPNNPNLVQFVAQVQTNTGSFTASAGFDTTNGDVVSLT
jgi:hypothetical protein